MTDDLLKQLRRRMMVMGDPPSEIPDYYCTEAADRIEAQAAEIEQLRQFARNAERCAAHGLAGDWSIALHDIKREARAALGDTQ